MPFEDDQHEPARELEVTDAESAPLFDDIKAMDKVSKDIARTESATPMRAPSALERGERVRPDGTRENYERVEY